MRTTTPASCYRPRHHDAPFVRWRLGVLLVAIVSATTACHDDGMKTNPMAPAPPALGGGGGSNATRIVNSLADPGDGVCSNSECTLREAINAAQTTDHITFRSNLRGTIGLAGAELLISKGVIIDGPGAGELAVSGQNLSRVLLISGGASVTISALTITGGNAIPNAGGGISVQAGSRLTLIGSVVTGNSAGEGGGIFARGPLTLVGSTVAGNVATGFGGGIFTASDWIIRRSTISDNTASQGGGIDYLCDLACTAT